MAPGEQDRLAEAILSSGFQAALAIAGGGSGAAHALLSHPGASRFVLEVQVPYSPGALAAYLGGEPARACSESTARAMADRALEHAAGLGAERPLGVACTAALQTSRPRRGNDRAFVCFRRAGEEAFLQRLELSGTSRKEQEEELSTALLRALAGFVG